MNDILSRQEWVVMEALWNRSPMFLSEIMEAMAAAVDWNRSSYLTYLKRMTDKGYLGYKTVSGNRCYYPLVRREDCIEQESSYILSKLTENSAKMLLVSMIQKSGLSEQERKDLQQLIGTLERGQDKEM